MLRNAIYLCACSSLLLGAQGFLIGARTAASRLKPLSLELGELSSPKMPPFDPALIEAAREKLSWETDDANDDTPWESAELWIETRETLVDMWILPRDMSNGADGRYAAAATQSELRILELAPQLLRLRPADIIASAKALKGLPPALMRSEPMLLSYPAAQLEASLEVLAHRISGSKTEVMRVCRETPALLLDTVKERSRIILN